MISQRYADWIQRHPRLVLTLFALVLAASVLPASMIRSDFNLEGFYQEDDPIVRQYRQFESEFGRDDNMISVALEHESLLEAEGMAVMRWLQSELEGLEHVSEVRSILTAERMVNDGDELRFEPYIKGMSLAASEGTAQDVDGSGADPEADGAGAGRTGAGVAAGAVADPEAVSALLADPFVSGLLIDSTGTAASFIVEIAPGQNTYTNRNRIVDSIRMLDEQAMERFGTDLHVSGIPFFRNAYVNMLNGEIVMYIALSSVLIIMLLWYLYRSIWGVLLPMVIVWSTLLLTLAVIQVTGGFLEIMSSTIAPILLCVGVADTIHMISKFDDARNSGLERRESIVEMIRTLGSATLLTSVTTAIGFATLTTSSILPMKRFGLYTAIGVMIAYAVTMVVLPAALTLSKRQRIFNEGMSPFHRHSESVLARLAVFNREGRHGILAGGALLLLLSLGWMSGLQVNGRVFDDVSEETEVMQDFAWVSEHLAPVLPLEIVVRTGAEEGVLEPELLERIGRTERFLENFPEVRHVTSGRTLIREVEKLLHSDGGTAADPGEPPVDIASSQAVAQYALLLEVSASELLERYMNFTYDAVRISALVEDAGSKRVNEIRDALQAHVDETYPGMEVLLTGSTVVSADHVAKIVTSLTGSMLLAIALISLIMAGLFRDLRMVVISLVPNLIPLVITAGVMSMFGVDLKPSTAVIFTIAFGIAVDDTIHFLARFRIERERLGEVGKAIDFATRRTGRAIIITSIILLVGFGTLVTSDFVSTTMMGMMVSATILSALFADLMLLPALIHLLIPSRAEGSPQTRLAPTPGSDHEAARPAAAHQG